MDFELPESVITVVKMLNLKIPDSDGVHGTFKQQQGQWLSAAQ